MLQKWSHDGTLLWLETWGTDESDYSYDAWSNQNKVFIVGATGESELKQDILIVAWDKNGTKLWDTKWNLNDFDLGTGIWGDNHSLYIGGYSLDWSTSSYGGEVSIALRYTFDGKFESEFFIENSQYASDIIGKENSLYILGHKGGGNIDTDIYVTELMKDFESNSENIAGFPLLILALVSMSMVTLIIKRQYKRINAN